MTQGTVRAGYEGQNMDFHEGAFIDYQINYHMCEM